MKRRSVETQSSDRLCTAFTAKRATVRAFHTRYAYVVILNKPGTQPRRCGDRTPLTTRSRETKRSIVRIALILTNIVADDRRMIDRPLLYLYFNPVNVQEVAVFHSQVVRCRLGLAGNVVSSN
jgi:hypothetical protein